VLAALPSVGYAQEPATSLPTCLADNTSGKDRKDLARWIFLAIGAHPENKPFLTNGTGQVTDDANKATAALFMRLLTDTCAAQTKAAVQVGGPQVIQAAFSELGKLAMQELMANPDVSAAMSALAKYVDQQKLAAVLGGK
jgi:hypothetical protein